MPEKADPVFAAAYIRVSTDDQVELSPESQLEEIKKFASREHIILLQDQIYVDAGISGKKAERRPQFMRMIATAKSPDCPFSCILLWKFSRFARNQEESIFYKSILRSKCGINVISVTEPLIAGPFGSLIERIIEWMDEFYSIRLSQEVKRSMKVNAERGRLQCTASFGYQIENGRLVPDPAEVPYVQMIFSQFLAGNGLFQIAKQLNAMGVKTHRGNSFENRTVEYILRNPVYIGKLRWNPSGKTGRDFSNENVIVADSDHKPLVSAEVWNAAQVQLDKVKAQWGYKARPAYELKRWPSGIVRCASCGATLIFAQPHYFKCNNYVRGRCGHSQHIRADLLEEAIISKLEEDAGSSANMDYKITYSTESNSRNISNIEASIRQLEHKRERLTQAYLAGIIELDDFAKNKQELEAAIVQEQVELENAKAHMDEGKIMDALRVSIRSALAMLHSADASIEDKNRAARSVIDRCTFDKENSVLSITYRAVV